MELEIYNSVDIEEKIGLISKMLNGKKAIVAFSGGVDSTVLAYLTGKFASETVLVMQTGSSVAIGEDTFAQEQAQQLDLQIEFIDYDEVDLSEDYASNPHNRCYFCKELLHEFLEMRRKQLDFDIVLSGTNASDLAGHRPGHQAALEAGVLNPLVDAGLTKQEIRWIAADVGLNAADKPASACLASRFVTGVRITKDGLHRVAKAEYYLKSVHKARVVRVRDLGGEAKIEFGAEELPKYLTKEVKNEIIRELMDLGFEKVSIDPEGYRPYVPVIE
ncbi:MAG: ATP-dependent sacrificial sulfur transferase LarE [Candidatus Kariarchaeaceae archaeon]